MLIKKRLVAYNFLTSGLALLFLWSAVFHFLFAHLCENLLVSLSLVVWSNTNLHNTPIAYWTSTFVTSKFHTWFGHIYKKTKITLKTEKEIKGRKWNIYSLKMAYYKYYKWSDVLWIGFKIRAKWPFPEINVVIYLLLNTEWMFLHFRLCSEYDMESNRGTEYLGWKPRFSVFSHMFAILYPSQIALYIPCNEIWDGYKMVGESC